MLRTVADGRTAISPEASQLTSPGIRDDRILLLRQAALEYANALEHKGSGLGTDSSDDPLEANERGRAVPAVHHQVLDLPFPLDIAAISLGDAGPSKSRQVLALTIGL